MRTLRAVIVFLFWIISLTFAGEISQQLPLPDLPPVLSEADAMTAYEGLPHHLFESEAHEKERKSKKVFSLQEQFFYEQPLPVSETDLQTLHNLFAYSSVCTPSNGMLKLCGGFHADYMIEWKKDRARISAIIICFGCHETRIVIGEKVYFTDLSEDGVKALHAVLEGYRQQRPEAGERVEIKFERVLPRSVPIEIERPVQK